MAGADPVRIEGDAGLHSGILFLSARFNAYQARVQGKPLVSFVADAPRGRVGLTFGDAGGGRWCAPVTGAFGGLACEDEPSPEIASAIVEAATTWLRETGASGVVRLPPDGLQIRGAALLENALFRAGWRLSQSDLNFHLPVTDPESFVRALGETKQKEVRRLKRSGAVVARPSGAAARSAYDAIAENRAAQGYPLSMPWPALADLAQTFAHEVMFYDVRRGDDVLAGAVCLQVSSACRYVFYWGERPAFRRESPVLLLAEAIMADAHADGLRLLDVGTASDASAPNPGLIAFKRSLGCSATSRRTWALDARPIPTHA